MSQYCGNPECMKDLVVGESLTLDKHNNQQVCPQCYIDRFNFCKDHGIGEFFEANYHYSDYPPDFWQSVGAFVDLSNAHSAPSIGSQADLAAIKGKMKPYAKYMEEGE